jgi:hypothetical protein
LLTARLGEWVFSLVLFFFSGGEGLGLSGASKGPRVSG